MDVEEMKRQLERLKFPQYQCVKGILASDVPEETIKKQNHNKVISQAISTIEAQQRALEALWRVLNKNSLTDFERVHDAKIILAALKEDKS